MQQLPRWVLVLRLLPGGLPGQRHPLRGPGRGGCLAWERVPQDVWGWAQAHLCVSPQCAVVTDVCFSTSKSNRCVNTNPGFHCLPCPPRYKGSQPFSVGLEAARTEKQVRCSWCSCQAFRLSCSLARTWENGMGERRKGHTLGRPQELLPVVAAGGRASATSPPMGGGPTHRP